MTFDEIARRLCDSGIENGRAEARLLIEAFCGLDAYAADFKNTEYDSQKLSDAVEKRCQRFPLQYIIGEWGFANCSFIVNENCLIPRADTEILVSLAQKLLPEKAHFADLCTGSGCIAVSILNLREDTTADAYELFPKTLEIAKQNAERNNVLNRFSAFCGDVLDKALLSDKKYDAIISNPPYIQSDVINTLEKEVLHEPRAALDGGEDGLTFYRAIVEYFGENLSTNGFFLFEIGYDLADGLKSIAGAHGYSCEIFKDYGGCDRAAILKRK